MDAKRISKEKILKAITYSASGDFTSNLSGRKIGYIDSDGYEIINIYKTEYRSHRLALIVNDINIDNMEVDHIDGNRSNNKLSNLRAVTKKENAKNKRLRKNNKTGVHGVGWAKELGKWRARISTATNRHKSLGCFSSLFDAICARKSAEIKYGYHINHGRFST
jgi:hypothetical protein